MSGHSAHRQLLLVTSPIIAGAYRCAINNRFLLQLQDQHRAYLASSQLLTPNSHPAKPLPQAVPQARNGDRQPPLQPSESVVTKRKDSPMSSAAASCSREHHVMPYCTIALVARAASSSLPTYRNVYFSGNELLCTSRRVEQNGLCFMRFCHL